MIYTLNFIYVQQPVNHTLITKQHITDTSMHESKLRGGALIDTINSPDKKLQHRPIHPDTAIHRRDTSAIRHH